MPMMRDTDHRSLILKRREKSGFDEVEATISARIGGSLAGVENIAISELLGKRPVLVSFYRAVGLLGRLTMGHRLGGQWEQKKQV